MSSARKLLKSLEKARRDGRAKVLAPGERVVDTKDAGEHFAVATKRVSPEAERIVRDMKEDDRPFVAPKQTFGSKHTSKLTQSEVRTSSEPTEPMDHSTEPHIDTPGFAANQTREILNRPIEVRQTRDPARIIDPSELAEARAPRRSPLVEWFKKRKPKI